MGGPKQRGMIQYCKSPNTAVPLHLVPYTSCHLLLHHVSRLIVGGWRYMGRKTRPLWLKSGSLGYTRWQSQASGRAWTAHVRNDPHAGRSTFNRRNWTPESTALPSHFPSTPPSPELTLQLCRHTPKSPLPVSSRAISLTVSHASCTRRRTLLFLLLPVRQCPLFLVIT